MHMLRLNGLLSGERGRLRCVVGLIGVSLRAKSITGIKVSVQSGLTVETLSPPHQGNFDIQYSLAWHHRHSANLNILAENPCKTISHVRVNRGPRGHEH